MDEATYKSLMFRARDGQSRMKGVLTMRVNGFLITTAVAILVLLILTESAVALPAFARKYQTSCVTCHESFPRLNAVGEAFRLNGFKFVDDELYVKEEPLELGDEAYKRLWPKQAIWPSDIPGIPPLSFSMNSRFDYDVGGSKDARTNFNFPSEVKIFGAGTFGENISFFVELGFEQGGGGHGGHGGDGDEGGVETEIEGWVQFEDLFGPENMFNLRVGSVGMQEFGLFTARDHNRLTLNPYLYSSWAFPVPDEHLVEDIFGGGAVVQANAFTIHGQPGIEMNGFGKRWRYAVGVVNGNGSVSDDNSEKDLYLQLAYKFGGRSFDGTSSKDSSAMGGGAEPWQDNSVTLSLFGYKGTGTIKVAGQEREDDFWRIGPGLRWKHNDFALNVGYIFGRNEDPYGPLGSKSVNSESWFIEGEYFVLPWLITTARYEGLSLDLDSGIPALFIQPNQDRQRLILSAKALIRANLSLIVEARINTKDERSTRALRKGDLNDDDQIAFALNFAF